uniref:Uncharacterized protein n=1 Tax=Parascaris univalens TaxID=6257 RepID=A0A915AWV0_PARUN
MRIILLFRDFFKSLHFSIEMNSLLPLRLQFIQDGYNVGILEGSNSKKFETDFDVVRLRFEWRIKKVRSMVEFSS